VWAGGPKGGLKILAKSRKNAIRDLRAVFLLPAKLHGRLQRLESARGQDQQSKVARKSAKRESATAKLKGWRAISSYLGISETTAHRWTRAYFPFLPKKRNPEPILAGISLTGVPSGLFHHLGLRARGGEIRGAVLCCFADPTESTQS